MNRFSIIILRFVYAKISRNYEIFQKILKKVQPPTLRTKRSPAAAADRAKKLKYPSRRRRLPKRFLVAAAEERKKLKIFSRRRRERRRLTPLNRY